MPRPAVIAIFGPTGIGKTEVAIALGDRMRELGEDPVALSADALQVYAGLETLTGAPTPEQRRRLEHRLVGVIPIEETFSAGEYAERVHGEVDALLDQGQRPILVGGTGLYLRAALTELSLRPPPPPGVRERLMRELEQQGPAALHDLLGQRAPWAAARIEPGDRQRVVRALELLDAGELEPSPEESELWTDAMRHPTLLVGLVMDRPALYDRIDRRVDEMIAAGAEQEVVKAASAGASQTARKALGFAELLAGDVEGMKRRTRNYARRQLTWMRKLSGITVIDVADRGAGMVADDVLARWLA